jgi:hypothetical protein
MSRVPAIASLIVCLAVFGLSAASSDPRLAVERVEERSEIWIELSTPDGADRLLLRGTAAAVEPLVAGREAASVFAAWLEDGRRWSAFSRDGGESWSTARPVEMALRLKAGMALPGEPMPPAPGHLSARAGSRLFVVQFESVSLPEWRAALEDLGGEVLAHVPHNAHIVRIAPALAARAAQFEFVGRVEPYHPAYRLSPELRAWVDDSAREPAERRRVRAMVFEWGQEAKQRLLAAARALGAEVAAFWPSGHVLELWVTRDQLVALVHDDDLLWADPWTPRETDMDLVREDGGTNWLESFDGSCGQGVRGEVMDSGIQEDHMDFDGILLHTPASTSSHGTSTFGIVFGNGDRDGDGEAKGTGHMPCAEQGIFADYNEVDDRFAHTEELKHPPYEASFQTNSWGNSRTRAYTSISQEMDDIIWRLDIAILQSQSNAGNQDSRPQAWAKNIISVGGVYHEDTLDTSDDQWGGGASIGPAEDGRIKPDVCYWYDDIYTTTTGNGYTGGFGGTSAATPESAGILGLILQMWSDDVWGTEPEGSSVFERQPHASTLKALLINNAQQYDFSGEGDDLTRVHQGWGRPSARVARERAATSFVVDEEQPLQVGEIATYEVEVETGEAELKVTMVYPDPPGTTSAGLHRINDVDLRVVSPSGTIYHGNVGLKAAPDSSPGGTPNGIDTVENVFVRSPEAGRWTVEVSAAEVNEDGHLDTPEDDVVFALVVTGAAEQSCEGATVDFMATPNPARVGESVQFDSTVSGGAGGPYGYSWDFDADGVEDSTEADPVHVYPRPYDGLVQLRVIDAADCPTDTEREMVVTGADLRYRSHQLSEVDGNGNGLVDPGEIWDVFVDLDNRGDEAALGASARLVLSPLTPGPVAMLADSSTYGDIGAGATVTSASAYRFQVGQDFPCGENVVLDLVDIRSDDPDNRYPDEPAAVVVLCGGSGERQEFYAEGFESETGWTRNGEWQLGAPQGLGGGAAAPGFTPKPDPTAAAEGDQVAGNDLTGTGSFEGNYENSVNSALTSPPIDMSDWVLVELDYQRWLNVMPQDRAAFEISTSPGTWQPLFEVLDGLTEGAWTPIPVDLRDIADREETVRLRFTITSDDAAGASGWNVDDIHITGVRRDACVPTSRPVAGAAGALTLEREPGGDLRLEWAADCGAGGTYGIYRGDLVAGYPSIAPEPGGCALAGTSAVIPAGPGDADFFLVVPSTDAFEGSYGVDGDGVRRSAAAEACAPQDLVDECAP